jgi:hypothetical protein
MAGSIPGYVEAPRQNMGDVTLAQWDSRGAVLRVRIKNVNLQVFQEPGWTLHRCARGEMQVLIARVERLAT